MSLDYWDSQVSPALRAIERNARWASHHGREIVAAVPLLPRRPDFETLAYDALKVAEAELEIALRLVRTARETYDQKPMLLEAAE